MLQLIFIDISRLLDLGSGNPLVTMGRLFVLGGWIPLTIVFLWGAKRIWLLWRQNLFIRKLEYVILAIDVPKENEQLPKAVENIFAHLYGSFGGADFFEKWWGGKLQPLFSFEICSHGGYVQYYIRCQKRLRDLVESAIFSQYPEAEINEVEDYTLQFKHLKFPHPDFDTFGTEFMLKKPQYLPIRTYLEFEEKLAGEFKDPVGTLLESLSKIRPEEQVWIQLLAVPAPSDWKKEGEKFIRKTAGIKDAHKSTLAQSILDAPLKLVSDVIAHGGLVTPGEAKKKDDSSMFKMLLLTPDIKSTLDAVAMKMSKSGFLSKLRIVYLAPRRVKNTGRVFSTIKGAFNQYNALGANSFGGSIRSTTKEDHFWEKWTVNAKKNRIHRRYRNRSLDGATPTVMNIEELATIWHFPVMTVKAPLLKKTESRRAEPPFGLPVATRLPGEETPPTA